MLQYNIHHLELNLDNMPVIFVQILDLSFIYCKYSKTAIIQICDIMNFSVSPLDINWREEARVN